MNPRQPSLRSRLTFAKRLKPLLGALLLAMGVCGLQADVTETNTFAGLNKPIPDGLAAGVHDVRTISSDIIFISSVRVRLNISGNFNGDLYGYVRHSSGLCILLNRAGRTSSSQFGYSDSGLDLSFADAAANDVHDYRAVSNPPPGSPLTGTWQPDARKVHPGQVSGDSQRTAFLSTFNGLNANGAWTLFLADLDLGGTNMLASWTLEVTGTPRGTPSITWVNPADVTYGTALSGAQLNAMASVPGTFSYNPPAGSVLNAGSQQTLSVSFTPNDTNNYTTATANISLNVLPKALTVTAVNTNKTYGDTHAFAGTEFATEGLVNGDSVTSVTLTSAGAEATAIVGNYPIQPNAATGFGLDNYAITFLDGTLTVTTAALVVNADNLARAYGQTNPVFTGTVTGVQNEDNITANYTTTATANSPVGEYEIVHALTAPDDKLSNYTVFSTNGVLTVTPATISVNADNKFKTYGEALPELTASYAGFVLGEDTNVFTALATLTTAATLTSDVGSYPITASGATAPNYSFHYEEGVLTITQSLTIGAIVSSDNPAPPQATVTFTMSVSPIVPGSGVPGGTVNFRVDGNLAGSKSLSAGVAAFETNTLPPGTHSIVAEYAGDLNFQGVTNALEPAQVITAPIYAVQDIIERDPLQGVKVRASTLLANDFTTDTNGVMLNSFDPTSAGSGMVAMREGWIFYEPFPGFTNSDSFTYVITNADGLSATGTVSVLIRENVDPSQNVGLVQTLGNGDRRIQFLGIPGRTYSIQFTEELDPAQWQPLGTSQADDTGWFEFVDSPPTNAPARLYRSTSSTGNL